MARKKTAKRTAKRQSGLTASSTSMQKIEKDFQTAPSKLIAQLNKEINLLKKKESKFKTALSKSKNQSKTSENRVKVASKLKTTTGRKQLTAAKKIHGKNVKNQTLLSKQLQTLTKSLDTASNKQAKLVALRKNLSQFEKDWKNTKPAKTKITAKKTKKLKARSTTKTTRPTTTYQDKQPQQQEILERSYDHTIDETETTS